MTQSQSRFWKYLPFGGVLFLCILIPTIHAFESNTSLSSGMNPPVEANKMPPPRAYIDQERRGVPMPRKYANQEESMLPKYTQKQESTGTSILNGSCIGPTYGSNNFTRAVPSGPSNAQLTESSKVTVNKNLHKKPPRMRRENREEIEKRPFWNFFR